MKAKSEIERLANLPPDRVGDHRFVYLRFKHCWTKRPPTKAELEAALNGEPLPISHPIPNRRKRKPSK